MLFLCLSILYCLESVTSVARSLGYWFDSPAAGFTLQQSLAVFSRAVMMLFMPLLGLLADKNALKIDDLFFLAMCVPVLFLFGTHLARRFFYFGFSVPIFSIIKHGKLFSRNFLNLKSRDDFESRHLKAKDAASRVAEETVRKFRAFYFVVFLSYVPLYLSWPLVIVLLNALPENRAMIIGLSSWLSGINTLAISLYIDPKLAYLAKDLGKAYIIYDHLLIVRFWACFVATLLVSIIVISLPF